MRTAGEEREEREQLDGAREHCRIIGKSEGRWVMYLAHAQVRGLKAKASESRRGTAVQ
jgi:hypothetical protein